MGEKHNCPEKYEGFYDIEEGSALVCKSCFEKDYKEQITIKLPHYALNSDRENIVNNELQLSFM